MQTQKSLSSHADYYHIALNSHPHWWLWPFCFWLKFNVYNFNNVAIGTRRQEYTYKGTWRRWRLNWCTHKCTRSRALQGNKKHILPFGVSRGKQTRAHNNMNGGVYTQVYSEKFGRSQYVLLSAWRIANYFGKVLRPFVPTIECGNEQQ